MDIKKETVKKLQYNEKKLLELLELLDKVNDSISSNAKDYLISSIRRTNENMAYYNEVLKALKNI